MWANTSAARPARPVSEATVSDKTKKKQQSRARRHARVRKTVIGTAERPRLSVFRSNRHIVAQVIDDQAGVTIAAASTLETGNELSGSKSENAAVWKAMATSGSLSTTSPRALSTRSVHGLPRILTGRSTTVAEAEVAREVSSLEWSLSNSAQWGQE